MDMPASPVCGLSSLHGESIPLQSVQVDVVFNNLLCETLIKQTYRNQEKEPLEAVYTFPLPSQADLLDLAVTIGVCTLQGRVIKESTSEEQYEEAIVATVAIPGPAVPQDILLITDGEIWQSEELVTMMRRTAHRVFAVGVGSAVAEGVLHRLAQETGGACESVAPREGMAAKNGSGHFCLPM